ncbi:DUF3306 domain-containing protein [Variovorax sp. PCZ-1]|uniref:DUF3306 domain-containing protein n=1 Tax=Variovorax sp. PCZ-1 TaxID=2835533 RepID=UPI001BCDA7E2|nr:DUF3306 domain-containing protein [Variovorax sp. PCZ-1]MBS7807590.1 DUF3306 domain-containing protein [Variovorax sp. PCZ-1]
MAADKAVPEESGFLARWSQRKQALRKGEELSEPQAPKKNEFLEQKQPVAGIHTAQNAPDLIVSETEVEEAKALPPAPTMKDVHGLTPESDFKPFMRTDVTPEVKNAAMKQLFKDPHFNTMDMMDVYVDDYSKPDPLPPEMLRKMAVTQFLGFWKEEEEDATKKLAEQKAREDAESSLGENVAQSGLEKSTPETIQESHASSSEALATEHDHPDLQLQPDDAAGRQSALKRAG